jgi:hypothetical protein
MAIKKAKHLSAQVMLRSASGAAPDSATAITSENVREYLPSASSAKDARRAFEAAGFEVGEIVGNSFSITAPASRFEKVFKVKLQRDEQKGVTARIAATGEEAYELPIGKLAGDLKDHVVAVTFTPPPDFGPTSYS